MEYDRSPLGRGKLTILFDEATSRPCGQAVGGNAGLAQADPTLAGASPRSITVKVAYATDEALFSSCKGRERTRAVVSFRIWSLSTSLHREYVAATDLSANFTLPHSVCFLQCITN